MEGQAVRRRVDNDAAREIAVLGTFEASLTTDDPSVVGATRGAKREVALEGTAEVLRPNTSAGRVAHAGAKLEPVRPSPLRWRRYREGEIGNESSTFCATDALEPRQPIIGHDQQRPG